MPAVHGASVSPRQDVPSPGSQPRRLGGSSVPLFGRASSWRAVESWRSRYTVVSRELSARPVRSSRVQPIPTLGRPHPKRKAALGASPAVYQLSTSTSTPPPRAATAPLAILWHRHRHRRGQHGPRTLRRPPHRAQGLLRHRPRRIPTRAARPAPPTPSPMRRTSSDASRASPPGARPGERPWEPHRGRRPTSRRTSARTCTTTHTRQAQHRHPLSREPPRRTRPDAAKFLYTLKQRAAPTSNARHGCEGCDRTAYDR